MLVRAKLAQAVQKSVNFIWNTLQPHDQSRARKAMEDDDLPEMWKLFQLARTQETLDQLGELMTKLECDPRNPLKLVNDCQEHQERLHSSELGLRLGLRCQATAWVWMGGVQAQAQYSACPRFWRARCWCRSLAQHHWKEQAKHPSGWLQQACKLPQGIRC